MELGALEAEQEVASSSSYISKSKSSFAAAAASISFPSPPLFVCNCSFLSHKHNPLPSSLEPRWFMRWLVSPAVLHRRRLFLRSTTNRSQRRCTTAMQTAPAAGRGSSARGATGAPPRTPSSRSSSRSTGPRTGTSSPRTSTADQVRSRTQCVCHRFPSRVSASCALT